MNACRGRNDAKTNNNMNACRGTDNIKFLSKRGKK